MKQEEKSKSAVVSGNLTPSRLEKLKKLAHKKAKPSIAAIDKDPKPADSKKKTKVLASAFILVVLVLGGLAVITLRKDNQKTPPTKSESLLSLEQVNLEGVEPKLASQELLLIGAGYAKEGFNKEAEDSYMKALKLVSGDDRKDPLTMLYKFYILNNNESQAKETASQLVEILIRRNNAFSYPDIVELKTYLGDTAKAQEYQKKYDEAIKKLPPSTNPQAPEGPN